MALHMPGEEFSRLDGVNAIRLRSDAIDAKRHAQKYAQYAIGALEAWRAADASTKQAGALESRD